MLNYSNPEERAMAETLRECEVPFKIHGKLYFWHVVVQYT